MILVLGKDSPQAVRDEIVREVERLGWTCSVSDGDEQVVLALAGTGDPAALERFLAEREEIDVIPILGQREYALLRTRRRLMGGLVAGLGLLTAGAAGVPLVGFLLPPRGMLADRALVPAGKRDDFDELSARRIRVLGEPVLLVRLEHGRFFALSATCTHMGVCQLDWAPERRQLVCGCHGGAFDVHGNVVQGPPSIPLASYPVEEIRGELYIRREA
jgi:Rieske Fe-S protein